jgi:hypothetical protein
MKRDTVTMNTVNVEHLPAISALMAILVLNVTNILLLFVMGPQELVYDLINVRTAFIVLSLICIVSSVALIVIDICIILGANRLVCEYIGIFFYKVKNLEKYFVHKSMKTRFRAYLKECSEMLFLIAFTIIAFIISVSLIPLLHDKMWTW